ncbi:MAG: transcription antitermination factor NusB [Gammaproteobacteria bacterium]|nr:transcription antitermination factor NusB [Gammaproteobacteria bacterium]
MSENLPLSRRGLARRLTVQALYQWLVNETPPERLLNQFSEDPGLGRADGEYFGNLLRGTVEVAATVTETFKPFLDRPLEQLDPVERAILMLGAYELLHRPEVPWRVVVNEAVNLAKLFGAEDSYKYVNGVLDRLARDARRAEVEVGP